MANTRAIIRTRAIRYELGVLYAALAFCSLLNLFLTLTPVAKSNAKIDERLQKSDSVPANDRPGLYASLLAEQEKNLAREPSEPYGWARLAYLRMATAPRDRASAFDALRISDLVSPYEAIQLPERAVMWHMFRSVENPDQQAYQDVLWARAYGTQPDATWTSAAHNNLDTEVGASLKKSSPTLYEEWKGREAAKH